MDVKKALVLVGYNCDQNCFFCSAEAFTNKEINRTTRDILRDVSEKRQSGTDILELIGGEVLIRPDIGIIIGYAKKIGYSHISIETNGNVLSNYGYFEKLIQLGLDQITLSIHGSNGEINDLHTGRGGSFQLKTRALENFELLQDKYPIALNTNFVITAKNLQDIPAYMKFIDTFPSINKIIFALVRPILAYKKGYGEYLPDLFKLKQIFESMPVHPKIWIQYLPLCVLDKTYMDAYQNYFIKGKKEAILKSYGTGEDESLETAIQEACKQFPECKICKYNKKCRGVWREYADFFSLTKPPIFQKKLSLILK